MLQLQNVKKLPENWTTCELDNVLLKISNGANVIQYEEKVGYPICRIETIWKENIDLDRVKYIKENGREFIEKHALQYGDILLSHINSDAHLGKTGLFKNQVEILIHGINTLLIRPVEHFSSDFLNYQFKYLRVKGIFIDAAQRAVNQSSINQKKLKSFQIVVAPLHEQHRIVAKIEELFSELDKGIENLKTAQAQLKVYRQALLKHAFEGKLTAQWRAQRRVKQSVAPAQAGAQFLNDTNSRPTPSCGQALRGNNEAGSGNDKPLGTADALLKHIQQERAQRYQQQLADWEASGKQGSKPKPPKSLPPLTAEELAELPELPEGWVYIRVGAVIDDPTYGTSKKCDYEVDGIGVLRIPNVISGKVDASDLKFAQFTADEIASYKLNVGDILIIRSNGSVSIVGRCALVSSADIDYLYAGYLIRLRSNLHIVEPRFLLNTFALHSVRKQIEQKAKSTSGVNNINTGEIQSLVVALCSVEEQRQVHLELESRLSETDQLDQTITTSLQQAEALRQAILKKAFSGQLVPQDQNDESASELLARIRAGREQSDKPTRGRKAT